jgi:hypothetical protein
MMTQPLSDSTTWGLSPQAALLLSKEPDILRDLERDRLLPPLPPGYVPIVIEILFDDVPYLRSEQGIPIYVRDCRPDYQPQFVEYRFDDETAVFHIGGEYVINRIEGMAQVAGLQGFLS